MNEDKIERAKELISFGAEISGSTAGGVIGFVTAGLPGAIAGSVAGSFLTKGLEIVGDFALRDLSRREKMKAGAGLAFAYDKIINHLQDGHSPRNDGFFDRNYSGRSASDEILEGVLIKCKNEYQEKKLQYIGNIYANVAFMPDVTPEGAYSLVQMVQNLTYRQLCIIALIYNEYSEKRRLLPSYGPIDPDATYQIELEQILNMIRVLQNEREVYPQPTYLEDGQYFFGLTRIGRFHYNVMSLEDILEDDIRKLLARWFPRSFGIK